VDDPVTIWITISPPFARTILQASAIRIAFDRDPEDHS